MIATSMALLSTGGDLVPTDREAATLVQSGLLLSGERRSEERAQSELGVSAEDVQIYDGDLLLDSSLLLGGPSSTGNSIGNFSPVYSPVSNASADSGIGSAAGGLVSPTENDTFLAELFGSDFPLLSQCSTTTIATTTSSSESVPTVSSKPTAATTSANSIGPLVSSFFLKHMQTEQSQQTSTSTETSSKIKESEAERNRKNAEAARQNRLKKKRYLEELEKEHSDVKRENVILKTRCHEFQQRCQRLQSEVEYLKNVIANESMLSSLIQNIPNVPNVKLSSSFASRKRPQAGSSEDGTPASKRSKSTESTSTGVCLHVAKDQVSIEFCQHCSKQATQS